jgi:hypothetical protein
VKFCAISKNFQLLISPSTSSTEKSWLDKQIQNYSMLIVDGEMSKVSPTIQTDIFSRMTKKMTRR